MRNVSRMLAALLIAVLIPQISLAVPGDTIMSLPCPYTGPQGLAFDDKGRLFVAEQHRHRILVFFASP